MFSHPPVALSVIMLLAVMTELVWSRRSGRSVYILAETMSNLGMMVVNRAIKPLTLAWSYLVLSLVEPFQIVHIPETGGALLLGFLITELAYYWYHRLSHEIPVLWTMHHTHHSSPWMNLTTALRLNWVAKFVSPLFFAPLVWIGLSPAVVAGSLAAGLLYQFFLHTESIGTLGSFEGKLLNTPSAHRVHHGSNPEYIDKNYGGMLIVWDRLFGTYQPEVEAVRYGVTTGFQGHSIFTAQFRPLYNYLLGNWKTEKAMASATKGTP